MVQWYEQQREGVDGGFWGGCVGGGWGPAAVVRQLQARLLPCSHSQGPTQGPRRERSGLQEK